MVMVRELPLLPSPPTLNQKAQLPPGKLAAAGLTYFCVFGLGWVVRGTSVYLAQVILRPYISLFLILNI